jgi:hypothetical protein
MTEAVPRAGVRQGIRRRALFACLPVAAAAVSLRPAAGGAVRPEAALPGFAEAWRDHACAGTAPGTLFDADAAIAAGRCPVCGCGLAEGATDHGEAGLAGAPAAAPAAGAPRPPAGALPR